MKDLLTFLLEHMAGRVDRRADILSCEWMIGNGQCPVCYGLSPLVVGWESSTTGHKEGCLFECVLRALRSDAGVKALLFPNEQLSYEPDLTLALKTRLDLNAKQLAAKDAEIERLKEQYEDRH